MKAKKIIVAVSLEEEAQKPLSAIKELDLDLDAEIHLVNVMPVILYARGMHFAVMTYPLPEERARIEERVTSALADLKEDILPKHQRIHYKCLFDSNIKAAFTEYVKKQNADLVIVATRGKHGLKTFFDSSFAHHQLKYSPANVLIIR